MTGRKERKKKKKKKEEKVNSRDLHILEVEAHIPTFPDHTILDSLSGCSSSHADTEPVATVVPLINPRRCKCSPC